MAKNWRVRLQDTWDFINTIPGVPAGSVAALQGYHNGLTMAQRHQVSNAMAQGGYNNPRPGIKIGGARTAAQANRDAEERHRHFRRAMILIFMAKRNSGNFATDLGDAQVAVPANITGEAEFRVKAELIDLNTSVMMMQAGGQVSPGGGWGGWDGTRQRPLLAGCAIGRRGAQGPGTLGCFVTIGPDVFILSNRHVLRQASMGGPAADDEVIQPPHQLGGSYFDVVADMHDEEPTLDAAIAKVRTGIHCHNTTVQGTAIAGHAAAALNDIVRKSGCATRQRCGNVVNIVAPNVNQGAGIILQDQLLIDQNNLLDPFQNEIFQVKGDSGSVALNHHNDVVALLHGQAGAAGVQGTHIGPILARFNAAILVGAMVAP